jgi:hypothetical protein
MNRSGRGLLLFDESQVRISKFWLTRLFLEIDRLYEFRLTISWGNGCLGRNKTDAFFIIP